MKWLLTVSADTDLDALATELASFGCLLEDVQPVPLGEDEKVIYAEAPRDLPHRLKSAKTQVRDVSPSSEFELHVSSGTL